MVENTSDVEIRSQDRAGKGHYVMAEATNTGRFQPAG
jgi:hypothetical protein